MGIKKIELHAQLHFGESTYFDYFNSKEFINRHDAVHFELLVDQDLLKTSSSSSSGGSRQVKSAIMASPNDQNLARPYGWECQVDSIDYTQRNWYHADLTRQEFVHLANNNNNANGSSSNNDDSSMPLWKLAASSSSKNSPQSSSSAAAEAMSALMVGPPTLSYSTPFLKRRLFTNLFLPGDALANNLRALLWMTVPCPELSIILLDWSSLIQGGSNPNALSKVALPILSGLLRLNIQQIRQFLFGQVLVSSSSSSDDSDGWSLLVTKRNDHALNVVEDYFNNNNKGSSTSTALLYGSSHCPDLHTKLQSMGFQPTTTTWRTAWSVEEESSKDPNQLVPGIAILLLAYLGIGALDWVGMMGDVSQSWFEQHDYIDAIFLGGFYLLRHVLLYLGLSKFLVDWDTTTTTSNKR